MTRPLTRRQSEILMFLNQFLAQHHYAPSLEEIARALNLSAIATVHKHLTHLAEKGYIKRAWNRSRSIEICVAADTCPTCGQPMPTKAVASV
jgi:repressor LexA